MATCSTTSTYTNILNLPQITNVEAGNFLIIQTEDTTNIIDFENFLIPLENTTFSGTISTHSVDIVNLQSSVNTLCATIASGVQYLNDPKIANIRISLDANKAIPTSNIVGAAANTLYIHPFNGGDVSLYSASSGTWTVYTITTPMSQSLESLAANSIYDVFLGAREGIYRIALNQWTGSEPPIRKYINGVATANFDDELRLIGSIRTVAAGQSEQSFGGSAVGGSHPKQFVWNAQNRVPITCYNWEPTSYTVVDTNTGWRKLNNSANNRFSFLLGERAFVDVVGQLYSQAPSNTGSYVSFVVDNDISNDPNIPEVTISEFVGLTTSPVCNLKNTFSAGYHYCQLVEQFNSIGVTTTINSDNKIGQTGFIANITI